jgi:hypothetical protein
MSPIEPPPLTGAHPTHNSNEPIAPMKVICNLEIFICCPVFRHFDAAESMKTSVNPAFLVNPEVR